MALKNYFGMGDRESASSTFLQLIVCIHVAMTTPIDLMI